MIEPNFDVQEIVPGKGYWAQGAWWARRGYWYVRYPVGPALAEHCAYDPKFLKGLESIYLWRADKKFDELEETTRRARENMKLSEYEVWVLSRCYYPPQHGKFYCATALAGEVGEICNEVKKEYRDGKDIDDIVKDELGDVLFYCIALAHEYGVSIGEVIEHNVAKLTERQKND